MKKINIITLGCSKNTVDSEHLAAQLHEYGYKIVFDSDRTDADVVVINTKQENNFKLTPEELRNAITPKTKLLVLPFPNNPTGGVMSMGDEPGEQPCHLPCHPGYPERSLPCS